MSRKILEVNIHVGSEMTNIEHKFKTVNALEQLAATEMVINYFLKLKDKMLNQQNPSKN